MEITTRIYKGTGFNNTNIPDNHSLLNSCSHIDLEYSVVKQDKFIKTLKIATTYDNLENADYCQIGYIYYFINDINQINPKVCELTLTEDYITTLGGPSTLSYSDGWLERRHVNDDTIFSNVIDEPFIPSNILEIKEDKFFKGTGTNDDLEVIGTTADLGELSETSLSAVL